MPDQPSPAQLRLVSAYHSEWASLVELAVVYRSGKPVDIVAIAKAAKKNPAAVTAKLSAISAAIEDGATPEQIIERGERETLQSKAKKRGASSADGLVGMNFRLPQDLKENIIASLEKIRLSMGYATMEHVWMWIDSLVTDMTIEEIRQLAGEGKQQ